MQFDENNNVLEKEISRAILVGASLGPDISYSMNELEGLAIADDIVVLGQNFILSSKASSSFSLMLFKSSMVSWR